MQNKKYWIIGIAIACIALFILFSGYKIGKDSNPILPNTKIEFRDSILTRYDTLLIKDTMRLVRTKNFYDTILIKNPLDSVLLNDLIVMKDSLKKLGTEYKLILDTAINDNNVKTEMNIQTDFIQNNISVLIRNHRTDTIPTKYVTIYLDKGFHWGDFGYGALSGFAVGLLIPILAK